MWYNQQVKGDTQKKRRAQASAAMEARIADAILRFGAIEFAIPSETMLIKSAFNATEEVRKFIQQRHVHDYEAQPPGRARNGVVKTIDYYSLDAAKDVRVRTIQLVLYRTAARAERRLNILGSKKFISENDFLAFVSLRPGDLRMVNLSRGLVRPDALPTDPRWLALAGLVPLEIPWEFEDEIDVNFHSDGNELPPRSRRGQGFEHDQAKKTAVENYAVERACEYYVNAGATILDQPGSPYDIRLQLNGIERRVEVKGSRASLDSVLVTRGEVNHARANRHVELFVVDQIELARAGGADDGWVAAGGRRRRWSNWLPSQTSLHPIAYSHDLPNSFKEVT